MKIVWELTLVLFLPSSHQHPRLIVVLVALALQPTGLTSALRLHQKLRSSHLCRPALDMASPAVVEVVVVAALAWRARLRLFLIGRPGQGRVAHSCEQGAA